MAAAMTLVPDDPLAHRALESLLRAEATVRRRLSADLEREGLSATGFSVLVVLATAGGELELRALRLRLRTSKANATEVVTTLEARGLVVRTRLVSDRRAASVALTALGPALEERVLERWRERDVFHESLRRRAGAQQWVFYEGPPTANGRPGSHHVLARVFKDIYPRFKTMRGYRVDRKGGWDCHGLPVEIAVEQKLGLQSKADIERLGIAEFNRLCRESVFEYLEDWTALPERIGFWLDLDDAYRTLDDSYIESVWWALRQIYDKGLLYESHRVVPYCPRDETALSSHEVSLGYRDVVDPSVYVRFPVVGRDESLLVWTTTPWTLVSNAAVAAHPELTYVRARKDGETYVLAELLVGRVLGSEGVEILARFPGTELEGTRYEPPFPFLPAS